MVSGLQGKAKNCVILPTVACKPCRMVTYMYMCSFAYVVIICCMHVQRGYSV